MGRQPRLWLLTAIVAVASITAGQGLVTTWALFTAQQPDGNSLTAAQIFSDERGAHAFTVNDRSSGSSTDGSSALGYTADGRWQVTRAWPSGADSGRYLEGDLNGPLPAGLATSSVDLTISLAADAGGTTVCYYVELRVASSGALVSSHGSSGSPIDCVTGTAFEATNVSLGAVDSTDEANDLRIRVYATNSASGNMRIDRLTVAGAHPYASFTLYPLLSRDVNGSDIQLIRWGLAVP